MAAAAILNFRKVLFWRWSHLNCPYISAHQIWCKLVKNWSRYALLCIFQDGNRHFWPLMTLILPVSTITPNLVQIDQGLAEICPFVYFSRWRPPPSWIFKKWLFRPLMTLILPVSTSTPNLVQIDQELTEIYPSVYFSRWRPASSWICYSSILDHPRCPICWVLCYLPMA